jgi:hypothetical protein
MGWGQAPGIFVGDMTPMNILAYIHRSHVTDEYIIIILGTEEYKGLYSSVLRSSAICRLTEEFNVNSSIL